MTRTVKAKSFGRLRRRVPYALAKYDATCACCSTVGTVSLGLPWTNYTRHAQAAKLMTVKDWRRHYVHGWLCPKHSTMKVN